MRVSNVQLQRWMETYQPPLSQSDFHHPQWCVYNGENTYAEDCQYTQRTGIDCTMKHKKRYSYQGWEYSDANKCTGRRMTFDGRSPNPGGASECTQHGRWCPGCLRQQAMLRREQLEYDARLHTNTLN